MNYEILGMCIFLGSYLFAWYYHEGLKRTMHPAILYFWGCISGFIYGIKI